MEQDKHSNEELVNEYRADITKLAKYIPWLEQKSGKEVSRMYTGQELELKSISFPTYDSTLLSFVKEAKNTKLMDKNYAYVYSRYRIRDYRDEWKLIETAKITDIPMLKGILSKYVLKGMTKGTVWSEAVEKQIFLRVLVKMKELVEFWDGPLA